MEATRTEEKIKINRATVAKQRRAGTSLILIYYQGWKERAQSPAHIGKKTTDELEKEGAMDRTSCSISPGHFALLQGL